MTYPRCLTHLICVAPLWLGLGSAAPLHGAPQFQVQQLPTVIQAEEVLEIPVQILALEPAHNLYLELWYRGERLLQMQQLIPGLGPQVLRLLAPSLPVGLVVTLRLYCAGTEPVSCQLQVVDPAAQLPETDPPLGEQGPWPEEQR